MCKKLKNITILISIICLCTALMVGCGNQSQSDTSESSQNTKQETKANKEDKETEGNKVSEEKELPVVGISTGFNGSSWRNLVTTGLEQVGEEYVNDGKIADYQIVHNANGGDVTEQANIIRDFISSGVDIILLNANSPDALNGVLQEAKEEGIQVVAFDSTVTAEGIMNVNLDQYNWMVKNVEYICSKLQKGNVVEIYGLDGHPANNSRMRATDDVLKKYPDINVVASTSGGWDQLKAKEVALQIIGSGQKIDGVITQDSMGYGVLSAFLDSGKLPKIMFGDPGTAFFKEWKKLRDKGADFEACTQPNPPGIGGTAFRMSLRLYNGKEFRDDVLRDGKYLYLPDAFYTDENFEEAWEILKDKPDDYFLTEIMPEEEVDKLFK